MEAKTPFQNALKEYLQGLAVSDILFAETLKKQNKNLADCETYILTEVKKTKRGGFADAEVYAMAVHYYDEDSIVVGKPIKAQVVINKSLPAPKEDPKPTVKKADVKPTAKGNYSELFTSDLLEDRPQDQWFLQTTYSRSLNLSKYLFNS